MKKHWVGNEMKCQDRKMFKGGKALVHFHIPNNLYAAYEACFEEQDYQSLVLDESIDHGISL